MKAFEEWYRVQDILDLPIDHYNLKCEKRKVWKAALKWVLNDVVPEAWDTIDVQDFIEEELKSE